MLKDKVAIITGGGSGLGEATCKLFAEQGAKVIVADFNFEASKRVSDEIFSAGGIAIPLKVNVADQESVNDMVWHVVHTFGAVDILINNAGITRDATLAKMTHSQWDEVIATNLTGVYNCTKAVIPYMIEQKFGRIVSTSSIVGRFGNFGQTNYAATKAGLIGMTQSWAKELGRKGITANAVAPGFISTPMTQKMPDKVLKMMEEKVPLQKLGEASDIANTFLFLVSDMGKYVNGAVIPVDGGLVI
jgi:3-oxoacyl-[acyl-carrier protein] reductase